MMLRENRVDFDPLTGVACFDLAEWQLILCTASTSIRMAVEMCRILQQAGLHLFPVSIELMAEIH